MLEIMAGLHVHDEKIDKMVYAHKTSSLVTVAIARSQLLSVANILNCLAMIVYMID